MIYILAVVTKKIFFFILQRNNCDWSLGLKDQWKGGLSPELAALQHTATVFKGAGRGSSGFWQLWRGKATCPRPQQRAGGSGGVDAPRHKLYGEKSPTPKWLQSGLFDSVMASNCFSAVFSRFWCHFSVSTTSEICFSWLHFI